MNNVDDLSAEARRRLVDLAWEAIRAHLSGDPPPGAGMEGLSWKAGAFVSLKRRTNHELRGCIGHMQADLAVCDAVTRSAVAAATADPRFSPVTLDELSSLVLEVSVLGPFHPIRPEDVEVGTHGLYIRYEGHGGVLLPQVAQTYGWDRETFLAHTCRKAGLPPSTWRKPDCEILGFTARVFGDEDA